VRASKHDRENGCNFMPGMTSYKDIVFPCLGSNGNGPPLHRIVRMKYEARLTKYLFPDFTDCVDTPLRLVVEGLVDRGMGSLSRERAVANIFGTIRCPGTGGVIKVFVHQAHNTVVAV